MAQTVFSSTTGVEASGLTMPLTATPLHVDTGVRTATAAAGAATLNKTSGVITTEALATAAGADYVLTLTNSQIAFADQVYASVGYVSCNQGSPGVTRVNGANGSVVIVIHNGHATLAFNGTLEVNFLVIKS